MRLGNLVEGNEAETKALITVCLVKIVKSRRVAHILCFATFVQRLSTRMFSDKEKQLIECKEQWRPTRKMLNLIPHTHYTVG